MNRQGRDGGNEHRRRRPDDRASIAEQVRDSVDRLTARERKAAQTLLTNYPTAGLAPVAEFAERAQVSAPTVLRFVAKLGFQGYPGFSAASARANSRLNSRRRSPSQRALSSALDPERAAIDPFVEAAIANVAGTFRTSARARNSWRSSISSAIGAAQCI